MKHYAASGPFSRYQECRKVNTLFFSAVLMGLKPANRDENRRRTIGSAQHRLRAGQSESRLLLWAWEPRPLGSGRFGSHGVPRTGVLQFTGAGGRFRRTHAAFAWQALFPHGSSESPGRPRMPGSRRWRGSIALHSG